uniref:Uncharacterized protein n=1 Tax=Arcella intermedia TaxID=1963864 RepID=A0A6B2LLD0_9EUKA
MERELEYERDTTVEKLYYPAYNLLLYTSFPATEGYVVAPVTLLEHNNDSIDFTVGYVVEVNKGPVFFVEMKAPANLQFGSKREEADVQMRRHFIQLLQECQFGELHGISVFGTKIAYYVGDKKTKAVAPLRGEFTNPPLDWWDNDILEMNGANKLRQVFADIKRNCNLVKNAK